MNADKIAAVAGTLGLVYGGFRRPEETHETRLGAAASADAENADRPVWANLGAIAMGGVRRILRSRGH